MKENALSATASKTSAFRIPHFFSYTREETQKPRRYALIRSPKIPSQAQALSANALKAQKRRQRPIIASCATQDPSFKLQPMQCSVNQKFSMRLSEKQKLSPERVMPWGYKEHFYVSEKLRALAEKMHTSTLHSQIAPLSSEEDTETPLAWQSLSEERRFQTDRVICYLK